MSSSSERRSRRWLRFSAILGATVILLLLSADYSRRLIREARSAELYSFDHDSWSAIAPVPARPIDLGGIFDGDLWLATDAGVFRFHGRQWVGCPDALKSKKPEALAASSRGVWVLDFYGNLSHFDGRRWNIESLAAKLPAVSWGTLAGGAGLATGEDGGLWLLRNGLWHESNSVWTEVRPGGQEVIGARLLGESAGTAWLAREGEVQAVTLEGRIDSHFQTDFPTLRPRDVHGVIASSGRVWVATATGLFDATSKRNLGMPSNSPEILDAAPGPDGSLFAIATEPPGGIQARLRLTLPLLLLSGSSAVFLIYLIYSFQRMRRERRQSGHAPAGRRWADPRNPVAARRCLEALKEGDYRGAMRKLQRLSFGLPSREMVLLEALVLSLAGMAEQAEQRCRRALGRGNSRNERFALDRLACVLMDLGRYEEARKCLGDAIALDQGFDLAWLDSAELLLREGGDPQRALDFVERAADAPRSPVADCPGRQTDAEIFAVRAWASAALGKRRDAEVSVQHALDCIDQTCRPVVAGIYWRISSALETMGDRNAATIHLRNAGLLDPHGKYGNLANAQIARHSASNVTA